MQIINLTQHQPTDEQLAAGVTPAHRRADHYFNLPASFLATVSVRSQRETLRGRAAYIIGDLVTPVIAANAQAQLHAGGYDCSPVEALDMLRPAVASSGIACLLGGHGALVAELERQLDKLGVMTCHALSERVSEEVKQADGSVRKINTFKHLGFLWTGTC